MNPYEIYMIKMTGNPISEMYSRICIESWEQHNYEINIFEAVTPKDLYLKKELKFKTLGNRKFTQTEIAVWYSHYELWKKCLKLKKPIIIIEHDSKLIKQLPEFDDKPFMFLSFIKRPWEKNRNFKYLAPGSGYYITPESAKLLVHLALARPLHQNSDGHLYICLIGPKYKLKNFNQNINCIEQISIDGLNTIDHKAKYKNFVGLDYEETDIPSLHGQEV
jgi:GR25 family glycosyltransferase involved in LPS biosynthesis